MERIYTKARKQYGKVYPAVATEFLAEVVKGKSIKLTCDAGYRAGRSNEFEIGDYAEYDSYNLSYYGPIVAIADKTVSIICKHDAARYARGEKVKTYRMDLNTFAWRNIDFNVSEASAANSETMMYI
jgi:hypothetical protein